MPCAGVAGANINFVNMPSRWRSSRSNSNSRSVSAAGRVITVWQAQPDEGLAMDHLLHLGHEWKSSGFCIFACGKVAATRVGGGDRGRALGICMALI